MLLKANVIYIWTLLYQNFLHLSSSRHRILDDKFSFYSILGSFITGTFAANIVCSHWQFSKQPFTL